MILDLGTVWLNSVTDPSDCLSLPLLQSKAVNQVQNATVTTYAGGRVRATSTPGQPWSAAIAISAVCPTDRAWIEGHAGQLIWFRDERGRKFAGIYLLTPQQIVDHQYDANCEISLTINEVTVSEAV